MSTIEARRCGALLLEGAELAAPLWALHAELVRRADYVRGRKREIVLPPALRAIARRARAGLLLAVELANQPD